MVQSRGLWFVVLISQIEDLTRFWLPEVHVIIDAILLFVCRLRADLYLYV
jgi:hypothetical protein